MLNFCDSFDCFSVTNDLTKKWGNLVGGSLATFSATGGKWGGGSLQIANNAAVNQIQINSKSGLLSSTTKQGAGFWYRNSIASGLPINAQSPVFTVGSTSATLFQLVITLAGVFQLANAGGTAQGSAGTTNVIDGNWHWIEILFQFGTTVQQLLRVDNNAEITQNLTLSASGTCDRFSLGNAKQSSNSGSTFIDDLILYDDQAGGLTTSAFPLGARRIGVKRPASDSSVQFARSTGASNFSCIDETAGDATDFVSSGTSGQKDLYGYSALGYSPSSINACVLNNYLENPNAGSINFKGACKNGATEVDGPSTAVPVAATTKQLEFPTDPATAAAWANVTAVDAALFGQLVV